MSGQFVVDGHTHFLRDDTRLAGFAKGREAVGRFGWNKALADKEQTLDEVKFSNYFKEVYMDNDTSVALLSNSPSEAPRDWFIPQEQVFATCQRVKSEAGARRMLAHFTITPDWPGWLDQIDEAIERFKPDSWKGYTIGGNPADDMAEFDETGRSSWTSDLAEIPERYGVNNVYGDLGQLFVWTAVAEPGLAAALMGTLVKGLGPDRILWGTDAVWAGAPQWQIEGLRRLEIPEDMRKKYGFAPLGPADSPVKTAIFSDNTARLYGLEKQAELTRHDRFAALKADYIVNGSRHRNLRYGYVAKPA